MSFQNTTVINIDCSDVHKLTVTALKTKFPKVKPKEVTYRIYKHFDEKMFRYELSEALKSNDKNNVNYEVFENIFLSVLERHAPLKNKFIRGNHMPYMNKTLRKAMMRRTQLHNIYYKTRDINDLNVYKKQNNFVSRLYKKNRKRFYNNIDI